MEKTHSLDDTLALMRDLRKRCEWDAAQTHESLRPYLIEEAHELDDAIRLEDDKLLREELGDLLLQVLFHSVLAEERGAFSFADVAAGLITKMKGRHPHLYGDAAKEPWERMKSRNRESIADGLPAALPALHRAHRLQDRRHVRGELKRVAVAARHDRGSATPLFLRDRGGEEVVRFVAGRLSVGERAGRDELRQNVELIQQLGVEGAPALIAFECAMPVGRRV